MSDLTVRLGCSFLAGVLFSQTGSFIQLISRNVLASPSTLGFDGLSVLWLLVFHSASLSFAIAPEPSALLAVGLPMFLGIGLFYARVLGSARSIERIVLLGLSFNLMVGAVFSLWQFFFMAFNLPFPVELWFGHFRFASVTGLLPLLLAEVALLSGLWWLRSEMFLFSLGPGISRNYLTRERLLVRFLLLAVSLGTFTVVGLFGSFSFLGLVLPIISRRLWFDRLGLKGELLAGSVVNGLALMTIDFLCYQFPIYGAEIPVGLVVTGVGAVSLMLLLWKTHNNRETLAKPRK